MGNTHGFIYVRINEYYDKYNLCKFGICSNLKITDGKFKHYEINKGQFILVIKVHFNDLNKYFDELYRSFVMIGYRHRNNSGCFFNKEIIDLIPTYLNNISYKYKILYKSEINKLTDNIKSKNNKCFDEENKYETLI